MTFRVLTVVVDPHGECPYCLSDNIDYFRHEEGVFDTQIWYCYEIDCRRHHVRDVRAIPR